MSSIAETVSYETRFAGTLEAVNQALDGYLSPGSQSSLQQTSFQQAVLPASPQPSIPPAHAIDGALSTNLAQGLWEAMRYSTLDGGKRIRSVLTIESCLACGGTIESALPTACAIELVHAQSLIHDDLPCMDDDALRRGKPTLHVAYGESTAVLAGDALLAMAFGLISRHTPLSERVNERALLSVISDFSDVTSVHGLVNGQYVDIQYEDQDFDAAVLEYIHNNKTAALFRFSTRAGALLAGAPDATVEAFTRFGQMIGLAFQIVDDVLDIQSTSETLGKTAGKDQAQKKATYPALYGLAESRAKAEQLIQDACRLIASCPNVQGEPLAELATFIHQRIS